MTGLLGGPTACPCGSDASYDACCGPLPRPPRLVEDGLDTSRTWTGLDVLDHGEDWVAFDAHYTVGGVAGVQHERSRFERRAGRWVYVDALD